MNLPTNRQALHELFATLRLIASVYMVWKALSCLTNTPCPLVVVTSESMEPGFRRGDILLLSNRQSHVQVGDIPVLWFRGRKLPMVCSAQKLVVVLRVVVNEFCVGRCTELSQRILLQVMDALETSRKFCIWHVMRRLFTKNTSQYLLTKGDNNIANDAALYPGDQKYATSDDVVGVVRGVMPFLGWPAIKLNELFARPTTYIS